MNLEAIKCWSDRYPEYVWDWEEKIRNGRTSIFIRLQTKDKTPGRWWEAPFIFFEDELEGLKQTTLVGSITYRLPMQGVEAVRALRAKLK